MRIALTLDRETEPSEENDYLRALVAAGAPRDAIQIVTPIHPRWRPFDALLLGGGADVDPARYGRRIREHGGVEVDAERDAIDFALWEEAHRAGAPVLGICRGLQVINVALGGTLVQDIPTERPSTVIHERSKAEKTWRDHPVAIAPGTRLARIAGPGTAEIPVNSRHHQAIDRVAFGLAVAGVAPDGIAEAVEAPGPPWLVAVQWHPENLEGDAFSDRLFAEFVQVAAAGARRSP